MLVKLLLLSILLHIIDDFVLQPVCLSKLKQKSFWEKEAPSALYKYDYIVALILHALSWSIMIMLPYIFYVETTASMYIWMAAVNTGIHAYVDHLKANKHEISLITDQIIHICQILFTGIAFMI